MTAICRQVSNRSGKLQEFAVKNEVVIFVSGKKSSNGMILYQVCRDVNPSTYLVSGKEDLRSEWFSGVGERRRLRRNFNPDVADGRSCSRNPYH